MTKRTNNRHTLIGRCRYLGAGSAAQVAASADAGFYIVRKKTFSLKSAAMATNKEWAMKMIPVLVRWAQATWDKPHYYSHLSKAVGHKTNQIGKIMAIVQDSLKQLEKLSRKKIPTLNALVQSKNTGVPSEGFDYVIPNYSQLSLDSKKGEVRSLNKAAHEFDWGWVLEALGLKPAMIIGKEALEEIKKEVGRSSGEGEEHRILKESIARHPRMVGIEGVAWAELEHVLLSGDRLDVYFECEGNKHWAVEVKPSTAPEADVTRGIFQCVKYKAVMDAMRVVDNDNYENEVMLVLGGSISVANRQLVNDLDIKYFELCNS